MTELDNQLFKQCMDKDAEEILLQKLIASGADINAETKNGTTPLITAVKFGASAAFIKALLDNGANVNAKTIKYETFLIRQSIEKHNIQLSESDSLSEEKLNLICKGVTDLFSNNGPAEYGDEDTIVEGSALLFAAKFNTNPLVLETLLKYGAEINEVDEEGRNALLFAATYNTNPQIIKILIDNGICITNLDNALYLACRYNSSIEVIRYLIKSGANTKAIIDNESLTYAASHNQNPEVLLEFANLDNNFDLANKSHLTKLLLYLVDSMDYNINTMKLLVERGANPNAKNKYGRTILYQILNNTTINKAEDVDIINMLLENGAKVTVDMLHWVKDPTIPGFKEILKSLVVKCNDTEDVFEHLIAYTNQTELLDILVEKGANPSAIQKKVELSQKHSNKTNKNTTYETIIPIFIAASSNPNPNVIDFFVKHGVNINYQTKTGYSALMAAIQNNSNPAVIEKLILCGADVNTVKTALIYAVNRKKYCQTEARTRLDIIKILLNAGAEVNATDSKGNTALIYATKNQDIDVIKLLLGHNADVNIYNQLGQNALSFVGKDQKAVYELLNLSNKNDSVDVALAQATDIESANQILKKSLSVNTLNEALVKAVPNNTNPDIINAIIEQGADVNKIVNEENSILMLSVRNSNTKVVEVLINRGADVNLKGKNKKSALIEAIKVKAPIATIQLLLRAGADINARDKQGKTALFYAAANNLSTDVFRVLLDFGADTNIVNYKGETPLLKLVSNKACLETFNRKEFRATIEQYLDNINLLINAGADPNIGKYLPLMEAVRLDDVQLAKLLLDSGANTNIESECYGTVHNLARSQQMKLLLQKHSV